MFLVGFPKKISCERFYNKPLLKKVATVLYCYLIHRVKHSIHVLFGKYSVYKILRNKRYHER